MTRQVIREYEELRESVKANEVFYEDYMAMKEDLNSLLSSVNNPLSALFGVGSPEGVVKSNLSRLYIDTGANNLYFNESFSADTGWLLL